MKQHATPVIIKGDQVESLVPLKSTSCDKDEKWFQNLCFKYPNLLPFTEIELYSDGMIPICRELRTDSGRADLIYINKYGLISIAECKLWQNPEAVRKVIGQVLDYAQSVSQWDYSEFESACLKAGKRNEKSLFEIIQSYNPETDEADFIDNVQKNLKEGRFLLLIIGDGIKENLEKLVEYLCRNKNLHFTLGLIELPIYKNPTNENELVITPKILAKTKEIKFYVSDSSEAKNQVEPVRERSQTISETEYFGQLAKNIGTEKTEEFEQLITTLSAQLDIKPSLGNKAGSINLKSLNGYNLMTIFQDGTIYFYRGTWNDAESIHLNYVNEIARVISGQIENGKLNFRIKKIDGHNFNITDLLEIKDRWIEILTETIDDIYRTEEDD